MNISGDRSDDCVDHHQRYAREDSCDVSDEEGIEVPEHDDICEMSDREQSERCQRQLQHRSPRYSSQASSQAVFSARLLAIL